MFCRRIPTYFGTLSQGPAAVTLPTGPEAAMGPQQPGEVEYAGAPTMPAVSPVDEAVAVRPVVPVVHAAPSSPAGGLWLALGAAIVYGMLFWVGRGRG